MPCADMDIHESQLSAYANTTHEGGEEPVDECSPFCYCTCCATFSINHHFPALISRTLYINDITENRITSNVIEIAQSIWQPPQLV